MRALIVAAITPCAACAEQALVRHHGVMPRGQATAERVRFARTEPGTENSIEIHVTPKRATFEPRNAPDKCALCARRALSRCKKA